MVKNYPNIGADIITITHPAFNGLTAENFFRWNGDVPGVGDRSPGAIFRCGIKPLNKTMVAVGGVGVARNSLYALAMMLSDVKVGKGIATLNQLEATCRYGNDSAATKYIQNLLKYVFSDETKYSTPLESFKLDKVDLNRCGLVDIGSGKRETVKGICFHVPEKAVKPEINRSIGIPVTKNVFYDPEYEAKYEKTHTDEGGLQHDYIDKIYILHGCESTGSGENIACYTLRYADDYTVRLKVTGGANIASADTIGDLPMAVNAGNGLFLTVWDNPHPAKKVKSLDVSCLGGKGFAVNGITCKLIRQRLHH